MEGGKLIGKGGYGCVFHPNINCSGKTSTVKKYVSKLQILNKKTQHEIEIGNFHDVFIRKMKKFNETKFFINSKTTFLNQSPRFIFEFFMILVILVLILFLKIRYTNTSQILTILGIYIATTVRLLPSLNKVIQSIQNIIFYKKF